MTPVIVPGLAAKRIRGVKDASEFDDGSLVFDGDAWPLSRYCYRPRPDAAQE